MADNLSVVIKEVAKGKVCQFENSKPLEVNLLQTVSDIPGVVRILDYHVTKESFFIVMEMFDGKDLFDYISESDPLGESVARMIFGQIVETVLDIQSKGVLHGDIKDENILINSDTLKVKLIDFGSGNWFNSSHIYNNYEGTIVYPPPVWISSRRLYAESLTL